MAAIEPDATITELWQEIERSESYLVCSMYEEASSSVSSVLKHLCFKYTENKEDIELHDMMESAAMVLVQALKELGRTGEILNEIKLVFSSVVAIPTQVVVTGVCFQISEGSLSGVRGFLEEFLSNWSLTDGNYYAPTSAGVNMSSDEGSAGPFVLDVDEYLEVVELYAVTLLGKVLNDTEFAVSWVEKAALPEGKRQALLRRLSSLYSLKATNLSCSSSSSMPVDNSEVQSSEELYIPGGALEAYRDKSGIVGKNITNQSYLKLSKRVDSCFWLFRTINLKLGKAQMAVSNGKILMGLLILLVVYVFRKKRAALMRIAGRQASAIKKALTDFWQLAFSYQVNPLAAVQPPPTTVHGPRG